MNKEFLKYLTEHIVVIQIVGDDYIPYFKGWVDLPLFRDIKVEIKNRDILLSGQFSMENMVKREVIENLYEFFKTPEGKFKYAPFVRKEYRKLKLNKILK